MSQEASSRGLAYASDPAWLPHIYDPDRDAFVFARLPRELQQRLTFLDARFVPQAALSPAVPASALPTDVIRDAARPMHFIFHSAFCCSTVLTRALDIPGVSMGLKEPSVLAYLGGYFATGLRAPSAERALSLSLDLLSRPLAVGETQITKPSNACNHMIARMMAARPDAKAIFLYSDLDAFLRATARRGAEGGSFARQLYGQFAHEIPLRLPKEESDPARLSDLQVAAQTWLMQIAVFASLAERFGPERVRILNSAALLARKAETMRAATRFLGLDVNEARIGAIVDGPAFSQHGKSPNVAFNTDAYRAQHQAAGAAHATEIGAALTWARRVSPLAHVPLSLTETLLD